MALNHNHQQQKLLLLLGVIKKGRSSTTIDNDNKIQLKQQSLTEVFSAKQQWDAAVRKLKVLNRAVATFIACDFRPYSVVEKR